MQAMVDVTPFRIIEASNATNLLRAGSYNNIHLEHAKMTSENTCSYTNQDECYDNVPVPHNLAVRCA